jgi:hypothetical protein
MIENHGLPPIHHHLHPRSAAERSERFTPELSWN